MDAVISGRKIPQDMDILCRKSDYWVYEEEYRLFQKAEDKGVYFDILPSAVILGLKDSERSKLFSMIADKFDIPVFVVLPTESGLEKFPYNDVSFKKSLENSKS